MRTGDAVMHTDVYIRNRTIDPIRDHFRFSDKPVHENQFYDPGFLGRSLGPENIPLHHSLDDDLSSITQE